MPELADGQALIRTLLLSVDPANRVWMSDMRGYKPPVPVGEVMDGIGAGEVVASRRPDLAEGALVTGRLGWQEHCVLPAARAVRVLPDPLPAPLPAFLGVLGHTGLTAYVGLEIGRPQPGETLVVSAAAGAVGSVAGQLAAVRGARAVGIAGGRRSAAASSASSASTPASTGTRPIGARRSTRPHPTASTSTSRTPAARSWTTCSCGSTAGRAWCSAG